MYRDGLLSASNLTELVVFVPYLYLKYLKALPALTSYFLYRKVNAIFFTLILPVFMGGRKFSFAIISRMEC